MKESKKTNTTAIPLISKDQQTAQVREEKVLAELEARLSKIGLPRCEVPSALDQAILAYAEQTQKKHAARKNSIRFIRKYALGLAAALAVCVSLTFVLQQNTAQKIPTLAGGTFYHTDDQDMMNMELFLISSSIRNSSERLTRTAALSAALDVPR